MTDISRVLASSKKLSYKYRVSNFRTILPVLESTVRLCNGPGTSVIVTAGVEDYNSFVT